VSLILRSHFKLTESGMSCLPFSSFGLLGFHQPNDFFLFFNVQSHGFRKEVYWFSSIRKKMMF